MIKKIEMWFLVLLLGLCAVDSETPTLPLIALNVTTPPFDGVYNCIAKHGRQRRSTVSVVSCKEEKGKYVLDSMSSMKGGSKVTRWLVKRSADHGDSETVLRSEPVPQNSLAPPSSPKFAFKILRWETSEELCSYLEATTSDRVVQSISFVVYEQVKGGRRFDSSCLSEAFTRARNRPALASMAFKDFDFRAAKEYLLEDGGLSGIVGKTAQVVLATLLGEHEASLSTLDFEGARGLLFSVPCFDAHETALHSLFGTVIGRLENFGGWNEVHMSLAMEMTAIGLEDLSSEHTVRVGSCEEFLLKEGLRRNEKFFWLRQCLNSMTPTTLSSVGEARERRVELLRLMDLWIEQNGDGKLTTSDPGLDIGIRHAFLLVYQGLDLDLDALTYGKMNDLHRSFTGGCIDFVGIENVSAPKRDKRRVGLMSNHLRFHSVGRLVRGVFSELNKERFELIIICHEGGLGDDLVGSDLRERADEILYLKGGVEKSQRDIVGLDLDVLVFADLGMDAKTTYLAYARLARVQVSFWGHPVSFALGSIDYAVMGHSFGNFQESYSEQLVEFEGLTTKFLLPENTEVFAGGWSDVGIDVKEGFRVYVCFQSIMKLSPAFDEVLLKLVEEDREGVVVLMEDERKAGWQRKVRQRIGDHPRIKFVKSLPYDDYMKLICSADVSLDPFPFGGGVTVLESLGCGVPVVTWGAAMKVFNLASAWNVKIGSEDTVSGVNDYVKEAIRLGEEIKVKRDELRSLAMANLHDRIGETEEWEDFLFTI